MKKQNTLIKIIGWLLLLLGVTLYVTPLLYDFTGYYSGLLAFGLIFVGITLLKYRKDQIDQ